MFLNWHKNIINKLSEIQKNAKSWLLRSARNLTNNTRKNKPMAYLIDSLPSIKASAQTPEQIVMLNDRDRELYTALNKINHSYREVLLLRKIKEFLSRNLLKSSENFSCSANKYI